MSRLFVFLLALFVTRTVFAAPDATRPYAQFIKDRQSFAWHFVWQSRGTTTLQMTSQTWKGTTWKHRVVIYQPKQLQFPDAATLFLTTRPLPFDALTGQRAADAIGAPFCIVYDVPNQPLWGKSENELFGYTASRALQSGDGTWSLAFPMARAAVRALDAVDAYNASVKSPKTKRWMLVGFSKRGLAAWLAATDPRVKGLVSLAYNNLNVPAQAKAQRSDWGELSPRLRPYLANGVEAAMETPRGEAILATWDPIQFRASLNKPKLVVDATGNDYWTLRAFDQYADDLPGTTDFLMVAGTDHYMVSAFNQVFGAATAWCHWTLSGRASPQPTLKRTGEIWRFEAPGASAATLYFAWSASDDFRGASWQSLPMEQNGGGFEARLPDAPQGKGKVAVFAAGSWADGTLTLPLSSRVSISRRDAEKTKP